MPLTMDTARECSLIVLRGVGQVMFQGHAGTGLCFLAGIGLASPLMLLGAILGATIGPAFAYFGTFEGDKIDQGIYGFNSTLVGLATLVFLRPESIITWILLVLGCVGATILTHLGVRRLKFPAYTAPFVVSTWSILMLAHSMPGAALAAPPPPAEVAPGAGFEVLRGVAEVMLGSNVATGALFLIGIALSNPWHAAMAFLGSMAGTAIAIYHGDPSRPLSAGIYGYNAALAAMALFLRRESLSLPILAALIATLLTEFFPKSTGLPALTSPFVAASWIVLGLVWSEERLFANRRDLA